MREFCRRRFRGPWRLATYAYWRVRLLIPWTETTFFRQVRRLRAQVPRDLEMNQGRKTILVFATRQDRDQLAMAITLAWALKRRGHTVRILGCDGILTKSCNYGHYPALSHWVCRSCALYARKTHALTGIPTEWLSSLVSREVRAGAEKRIDSLSPEEYPGFSYRGYHVGRFVRHSVAHFLRTDKITQESTSVRVYRDWLVTGTWLVDACEELLNRHQPDVVLLLNGLFAPEWIMLEAARRRGIRAVAWEVGFRPESFFFQHGRPTDMCDNDNWPLFRDRPLTENENKRLDHYLDERARGGGYLLTYFPRMENSREKICAELGIDVSKRTALLFPNITWDSTLFEKNIGFSGMADWIEETIRFLSGRSDVQLVVRVHPAEAVLPGASRDSVVQLIRDRFPVPPANLIIVPPESGISSYVLMDIADCGLVYGSTTGLEMGVRGIPVILAGQVYYRGLGVTLDPESREEYREIIESILSGKIARGDPEKVEMWRRYAYFAIFRSAIPLHQVAYEQVGTLPELRYERLDALDVGRDPNLDVVCDGITRGTPFLTARL